MTTPHEMPGADEPLAAIPVAAPLRYCSGCGQPWDPAWVECPVCVARRGNAGAVERAAAAFKSDQRRVKSAVALYFTLLGVSIISAIVLLVRGDDDATLGVEVAGTAAMSLIALIWSCFAWRDVWPLLRRLPRPHWLLLGAALAVCTMFIAHSVVVFLHHLADVPMTGYLDDFVRGGYGLGAAVLVVCVQPAIFEELGFRGVILSALEPVVGPGHALLVSSLMFAILHLAIPSIPHLFLMGIALAWLTQRTGSLYPGIVLHFTHNFLVLLSEQYGGMLPW